MLIFLLACICRPAEEPEIDVPDVDRGSVRGRTCFSDGEVRLALSLGASVDVEGELTWPGAPPRAVRGRRKGRQIALDGLDVELRGARVRMSGADGSWELAQVGCDQ